MTDESIQLVLDRVNSGAHTDIIIRQIGKRVWWGYAWGETDNGYEGEGRIQEKGYEFYFVQAKDRRFAAAVFRMGANEMHWYVDPEYRGKGILVEPLRKIILPFIFKLHFDEAEQEARIEAGRFAKFSAKLARKVGFRCVSTDGDKRKFVIKRRDVQRFRNRSWPRTTVEDLSEMETQLKRATRALMMIIDALHVRHFSPFEKTFPRLEDEQVECALYDLKALISTESERVQAESSGHRRMRPCRK